VSAQPASASAAASAVSSRAVSSSELVADAIDRIEREDGVLNAVPCRDFDRARRDALIADQAVADGARLPLLGVPITVKESFWVRGLPTCWGVPEFRDWRPKCDSHAVLRLRRAGAIVLGKTNIAAALADWQSSNAVFGRTSNPYDPSRTAGGSSGGSAAAITAGLSYLELGSDLAGSIRIPAHFCGVFGFRPSPGLISKRAYAFPKTILPNEITEIGPIARTVDDLVLAMDVLTGVPFPDALAWSVHLPPPRRESFENLRVLLLDAHPLVPTSAGIRDAVRDCGRKLAAAGAIVSDRDSQGLIDLAEDARLFVRLMTPANLSRVAPSHFAAMIERAQSVPESDDHLNAIALKACLTSARQLAISQESRFRRKLAWHRFFTKFDLIICPVSPTTAFPHDERMVEQRQLQIDDANVDYFDQLCWTASASLCGLPAASFPWTTDSSGLPIGLQAIGPQNEDQTVLAVLKEIERQFGGHRPPQSCVAPDNMQPAANRINVLAQSCNAGGRSAAAPDRAAELIGAGNAGPAQNQWDNQPHVG
jgi:amidase